VLVARLKLVHPPALLKVRETEPPPTLAVMSADWSVAWVGRRVLARIPIINMMLATNSMALAERFKLLTPAIISMLMRLF